MVPQAWAESLRRHPDQRFTAWLLRGLSEGFRIGYGGGSGKRTRVSRNLQSAREHPAVVDEYLNGEISAGRVVGPVPDAQTHLVRLSPFGVIPKSGQPGRWRLIVDLSSPRGSSVNDGIRPEWCSTKYIWVEDAVRHCWQLGAGATLAKLDIQSAYRIIPVHPVDRHLLGMRWRGRVYVDTVLPFGLRSAPAIFSAVADALLWIMYERGVRGGMHYLDDFLFIGRPQSQDCAQQLQAALRVCEELGVPVARGKIGGPSTTLVFLGIELNTVAGVLRLPQEKLQRLRQEIRHWQARRAGTKRELLSLIGSLQHAASVVPAGRSFTRRLIDASKSRRQLAQYVRLNAEARADLQWWSAFLERWNGKGFFATLAAEPRFVVGTDASGSWGCGAVWASHWFR